METKNEKIPLVHRWLLIPKLIYFLMCGAYYCCHTFRAKYMYQAQGISTKDYGLVAAFISLMASLAGYFWSWLADRIGNYKAILAGTMIASAAVFQFFIIKFPDDLRVYLTLGVYSIYIFFMGAPFPLQDALVMHILTTTPGASKEMYGNQWFWGTVSYAVVTLSISCVQDIVLFVNVTIIIFSVLYAVFIVCCVDNPGITLKGKESEDVEIKKQKDGDIAPKKDSEKKIDSHVEKLATKENKKTKSGLMILLTNANFLILLLIVFANGLGRATMTHFVEPLQRNVFKTPSNITGVAVVISAVFEGVCLYFGGRWLKIIGPRKMLLVGFGASVARICCYAFLPRDHPWGQYAPIVYDLFRGVSIAFTHIASVTWVSEISPPDAKAQAISIYTGVFSGLSSFLAGLVGYFIQSHGLSYHTLTPAEKITAEVERSIFLMQIMAYLSIGALFLFVAKYIIYDEYITGQRRTANDTKQF